MGNLELTPNVACPDDIYQMLVDLNEAGDVETALTRVNKLVLVLVNHIGDPAVIREAIDIAKTES